MIVWMLYSAVVTLIIAAGARAAELLARLAGYRVRWVWTGALALAMFLSASQALRGRGNPATAPNTTASVAVNSPVRSTVGASFGDALLIRVEGLRRSIAKPLWRAAASVDHVVSPAANMWARLAAAAISILLALVFVGVDYRVRRARRDWPFVTIGGVDVRLAPRIGPLVFGVVRPEIIVPRWLLRRDADDQRLVVAHENEHVRARDPLLFTLASAMAVLAPWNPAVWYMLSRLRLAIELDCDARVLRSGTVARSYGSLLIDVAQRASELQLSALALADDASHLHQRLLAMHRKAPRLARTRCVLAAAFSLVAALVACQTSLPSHSELAQVEADPTMAMRSGTGSALAIASSQQVDLSANERSNTGRLKIADTPTRNRARNPSVELRDASAEAVVDSIPATRTSFAAATPLPDDSTAANFSRVRQPFTGMIFIDGVRSTMDQLNTIPRTHVSTIDIIKGLAAAQEFNDPEAAKGVIVVKTKKVE